MAIGVRIRFEIFKRDDFTCRYCGRRSPEVVLEVDHIVPVSGGGTDDEPNLVTSCWECNRGKSNVPLSAMAWCPKEVVRNFMDMAIQRQMTKNLRYVAACCRNWRYEHAAQADLRGTDTDY